MVAPLLPVEPARLKDGPPRTSAHSALTDILFAVRSCIAREFLSQEMSCS